MKILFYPIIDRSKITLTHQLCDYMLDCLAHGCTKIEEDVEFATDMSHWYTNFTDKQNLYGRGFTISCLFDRIVPLAHDLDRKLSTNYYDYVIYSIHHTMHKQNNVYDLIKSHNIKNKIIVCGNDDATYESQYNNLGRYYKRELGNNSGYKIGFAIPEEKIISNVDIYKKQMVSIIVPKFGGFKTYEYTTEKDYYEEYQQSWFAFTWCKGGWDCMRHYEILANGCIPLFQHIHKRPKNALGYLPTDMFEYIIENYPFYQHNETWKIELMSNLLKYTFDHLTTKKQVERLIWK